MRCPVRPLRRLINGTARFFTARATFSKNSKSITIISWPSQIKFVSFALKSLELRPNNPGSPIAVPMQRTRSISPVVEPSASAFDRRAEAEANEARRKAIRDMLYRSEN